ETPARPPMDYLSVKFDMSTHTPRLDLYEEADENQAATVAVELVFIPNDPQFNNGPAPVGDLGVLAPSIRDLSVNRTDDILTLYGLFGENPGPDREVTVDGVPLTVQSWERARIVCDLPAVGPGSAGYAVVTVRGHDSNRAGPIPPPPPVGIQGAYNGTVTL